MIFAHFCHADDDDDSSNIRFFRSRPHPTGAFVLSAREREEQQFLGNSHHSEREGHTEKGKCRER